MNKVSFLNHLSFCLSTLRHLYFSLPQLTLAIVKFNTVVCLTFTVGTYCLCCRDVSQDCSHSMATVLLIMFSVNVFSFCMDFVNKCWHSSYWISWCLWCWVVMRYLVIWELETLLQLGHWVNWDNELIKPFHQRFPFVFRHADNIWHARVKQPLSSLTLFFYCFWMIFLLGQSSINIQNFKNFIQLISRTYFFVFYIHVRWFTKLHCIDDRGFWISLM